MSLGNGAGAGRRGMASKSGGDWAGGIGGEVSLYLDADSSQKAQGPVALCLSWLPPEKSGGRVGLLAIRGSLMPFGTTTRRHTRR